LRNKNKDKNEKLAQKIPIFSPKCRFIRINNVYHQNNKDYDNFSKSFKNPKFQKKNSV
jgi:hypothetical protein